MAMPRSRSAPWGNPSGAAAVEPEGKLLEVAIEVFEAYRPWWVLRRSDEPAAAPLRRLIELRQHRDDVSLRAGFAEFGIAAPAIRVGGFVATEVLLDEAD